MFFYKIKDKNFLQDKNSVWLEKALISGTMTLPPNKQNLCLKWIYGSRDSTIDWVHTLQTEKLGLISSPINGPEGTVGRNPWHRVRSNPNIDWVCPKTQNFKSRSRVMVQELKCLPCMGQS